MLATVESAMISIHALHEESDCPASKMDRSAISFQSTLSMRRATEREAQIAAYQAISIHALHEESDGAVDTRHVALFYFNPRSP